MKFQLVVLSVVVCGALGGKGSGNRQSVPVVPASGPSSQGFSQPIPASYAAPTAGGRQDVYSYNQPMVQASNQADYYQPMEGGAYGAYPPPAQRYNQQPYYEPVPQGSGHHPHHAVKRGHGYGWSPHTGIESIIFIALPLIILPLLLLWPYFMYAASHHHHPVVYAQGWKRSSDGKAPTVEEAKAKKTDELTEKILPKLEKASKSSKSS